MLLLSAASKVPSPYVVTYFLLSPVVLPEDVAYTPMASPAVQLLLSAVPRVLILLEISACTVAATGPLLPIPSSSLAQAANSSAAAAMY